MLDNLSTPQKLGGLLVLAVILYVAYTSKKKAENELVIEDVVGSTPQQTIAMNVEPQSEIYVTDIRITGDVVFAELELLNNNGINIIQNILPTSSGDIWPNHPIRNLTDGNTRSIAHIGRNHYQKDPNYWMNIKLKSPTKIKDLAKVKIYSRSGRMHFSYSNGTKIQLLSNGEVVLQNEWVYMNNPATPDQTIREYAVKQ